MRRKPDYLNEPVLPGLKPVLELLTEDPDRIVKILRKKNLRNRDIQIIDSLAHKYGIRIEDANIETLDKLCAGNVSISHQGILAILSRAKILSFSELCALTPDSPLPLLLALDQIQDQGNLGAIARSAYALGCAGICIGRHETASPGPGAYRASAGALDKIPLSIVVNLGKALDSAEENGFTIYGSISEKDAPTNVMLEKAWDVAWKFPAVLVLGSENRGLRPGISKRCSKFVTIPFVRNFDSLNIAQACAILVSQAACALYRSKNKSAI